MSDSAAPPDDLDRLPCHLCAERVKVEARICPHCGASALVDLVLLPPLPDGRLRYHLTSELRAIPGAPSSAEIRAAMAAPRPAVAQQVTQAFARTALGILKQRGVSASIVYAPPARKQSLPALPLALAVAVVVAFGGLAMLLLRPRRPAPVVPAASVAARPSSEPGSEDAALDPRALAKLCLPSTVSVRCKTSVGSGFFVSNNEVLTNAHVLCAPGEHPLVVLSDGRKLLGETVRSDTSIDLGLIKVVSAHERPLLLGDVADLALGDRVMFIGSPVGLEFTVHEGSVSNLFRATHGVAFVQLDAKVNPGNSGGPVIDSHGRVVGVVTLKVTADGIAEGIGLALPINYAYGKDLRFVEAPSSRAASSAVFEKMAARARDEAKAEGESDEPRRAARPSEGVGGDLLVSANSDTYGRMVLNIARLQAAPPGYEEITLNIWKNTEKVCTLKGDVATWRETDISRPGSGLPPASVQALRSHGIDTIYVGESPLRLELCPNARNGNFDLELEGANEHANRLQVFIH